MRCARETQPDESHSRARAGEQNRQICPGGAIQRRLDLAQGAEAFRIAKHAGSGNAVFVA